MTGFVRLWREIEEHAVWQDSSLLKLFLHLVMRAAHRPKCVSVTVGRGPRIIELKRGQLIVGRNSLAQRMGWPGGTTRDRLQRLQSLGCIRINPDKQFSLIDVVNYDKFQPLTSTRRQLAVNEILQPHGSDLTCGLTHPFDLQVVDSDNDTSTKRQPTDTKKNDQENSIKGSVFKKQRPVSVNPPSLEEIATEVRKRNLTIDPEEFQAHYEANGWVQSNGRPIVNWKATLTTWAKNEAKFSATARVNGRATNDSRLKEY